ncbi:hypothetical protein DFJ77DRAFT_470046 [Powellomyces hirtus]|nr:hypothetical protein DFJ77DRAFT_470046 [Powellomyces hirtus]
MISPPFDVKFRRLVDSGILRDNSGAAGLACLETLITLVRNALTGDAKYQSVRENNGAFKQKVIKAQCGQEALVEMGLIRKVTQFEAVWTFPADLEHDKLRLVLKIMEEYQEKALERKDREARTAKQKLEEEKIRRAQVLELIEEDREARARRASVLSARRRSSGAEVVAPAREGD